MAQPEAVKLEEWENGYCARFNVEMRVRSRAGTKAVVATGWNMNPGKLASLSTAYPGNRNAEVHQSCCQAHEPMRIGGNFGVGRTPRACGRPKRSCQSRCTSSASSRFRQVNVEMQRYASLTLGPAWGAGSCGQGLSSFGLVDQRMGIGIRYGG
jgi:hypothetical protein